MQEAGELEPLSPTAQRMAVLIGGNNWDLDEISRLISFDQVLTAKLLRVANSVLVGSRGLITTIDAAVMRMGPGSVLSLAVGSSVKRNLCAAFPEYGMGENELWRHSVAAALAAERARSLCGLKLPPEAFTAALMHDLGRLVIARCLTPDLIQLLSAVATCNWESATKVELETLGIHHALLGGAIAERWKLPPSIVAGITHHHAPHQAPPEFKAVAYAVNLGDMVAATIGAGVGHHEWKPVDSSHCLNALGLSHSEYSRLCDDVVESLDETMTRYE